ncbi:MAG: hypothetical protein KKE16_00425 [Firmicutes bacterium]|nr:hypothetical protein [Bacillota bacterium]
MLIQKKQKTIQLMKVIIYSRKNEIIDFFISDAFINNPSIDLRRLVR